MAIAITVVSKTEVRKILDSKVVFFESTTKETKNFYFPKYSDALEQYNELISEYEAKRESNNSVGIIDEINDDKYKVKKISYEELSTCHEDLSGCHEALDGVIMDVTTSTRYDIKIIFDVT